MTDQSKGKHDIKVALWPSFCSLTQYLAQYRIFPRCHFVKWFEPRITYSSAEKCTKKGGLFAPLFTSETREQKERHSATSEKKRGNWEDSFLKLGRD